ncbi:MAG: hypothetical protein JSR34_06415 [Proteobacteria bacterium]|nr:hypothetical protein [Pseudomonadota bacterium]
MSTPSEVNSLYRQIADSAGMRYLNGAHSRSFSFNIFQMNALELIEASRRVRDPELGLSLMLEKNREAGQQAHRELNRHVHNFVSSALTLVEHTRIFMRENYESTEIHKAYENYVESTFATEPVANFVQGLRNYMLHRGLPSSHMFLSFQSNPGATDGSATQETGVRYDTASLLEWNKWKQPARRYLEESGVNLDIHRFVEDYLVLVNRFHAWLGTALQAHHQTDLQELAQLQLRLAAEKPPTEPKKDFHDQGAGLVESEPFEFSSVRSALISQAAIKLLENLRELHFKPASSDEFPSQRPVNVAISSSDLVDTPVFWGLDINSERVVAFIEKDGKRLGLSEQDFRSLDDLIDVLLAASGTRSRLSRSFVEETFIGWARERFAGGERTFVDAVSALARDKVQQVEVWAPVAHLEIEEAFEFGPVRIAPMTAEQIDKMQALHANFPQDQAQPVKDTFDTFRKGVQGFAAVVISIEAEWGLAMERGRRVAQDVVSLLRFFSPGAMSSAEFCPVALMGSEYIPSSKLLLLAETGFCMSEGLVDQNVRFWRMPSKQLAHIRTSGLDNASLLVLPDGLSEFALAVRSSLILYSRGVTLTDPLDRLRHTVSALENVLLKHEMEPAAASVAARISFLVPKERRDRSLIAHMVQQVYWLQVHPHLEPLTPRESELLNTFTQYSYSALQTALCNMQSFNWKRDFVNAVDNMASSGSTCEG